MNCEIVEGALPADALFIHGNLASNDWWRPAIEAWRSQARERGERPRGRAILAEWRGCGQSPAPASEDELRPEALANDYLDLLRRLGVARTCVVGHSTGGLIALRAMAASPQLFDRAVLLDPVSHRGVPFGPEAFEAFRRMAAERAFCEAVMATTIHGSRADDPRFQKLVDGAFGVAPLVWTGVPKALSAEDATAILPRIAHPVLVLHGALDPILPSAGSAELARALPNASFLEVAGHGHSLNVEDPELFARLAGQHLFLTAGTKPQARSAGDLEDGERPLRARAHSTNFI